MNEAVPFFICPYGSRHRVQWKKIKIDGKDTEELAGYCKDCTEVFKISVDAQLLDSVLSVFEIVRSSNQDLEDTITKKLSLFGRLSKRYRVDIKDYILDTYIYPECTGFRSDLYLPTITKQDIVNYMLKSYTDVINFNNIIKWLDEVSIKSKSNIPVKTKELLDIVVCIDIELVIEVLDTLEYLTKVQDIESNGSKILEVLQKVNEHLENKTYNLINQAQVEGSKLENKTLYDSIKSNIVINIALNKLTSLKS